MKDRSSPRRRPTHIVCFLVGDGEGTSPIPAGAAWPQGDGYAIQLEAVPLNGLLTMQPHNGKATRDTRA